MLPTSAPGLVNYVTRAINVLRTSLVVAMRRLQRNQP
jgi:hypothetical protein